MNNTAPQFPWLCMMAFLPQSVSALADDLTQWYPFPSKSRPAALSAQAATLQSGEWSYLVAPTNSDNVDVSATVTIESPATQFDFFRSSWSAWPDPKFEDRGFEAGFALRSSKDGLSGYRVQLSSKYQEVALVRFPDGGFLRSVAGCPGDHRAGETYAAVVESIGFTHYRVPPLVTPNSFRSGV